MIFPKGLIVSIQPRAGSSFEGAEQRYIDECSVPGVVGFRINGPNAISSVRAVLPIIGIHKEVIDGRVVITPTAEDACDVCACGAHYVATDGTGRRGWLEIKRMVEKFSLRVIADISTIAEAQQAMDIGCVAVTTALSGYTEETAMKDLWQGPDIGLVSRCAEAGIPVIAEGRFHRPDQVWAAINMGAMAVCVGAAITMPRAIVSYLTQEIRCT